MISPSFERFSEICHLPSENYKNQVFGFKLNFPHLFCIWHHVGLYHRKAGTISFSNMYDTYRATCKKWQLCPRELWERCEKQKCGKLGGVKKNQKVHFFQIFKKPKKNMEPSEIQFLRTPCFLLFSKSNKKMHFLFFLRPNPRKSVLSRVLKLTL